MSSNVSVTDLPVKFHLKKSFHSGVKDSDLEKAIKKNNVRSFIRNGVNGSSRNFETEAEETYGLENHLNQLKRSCSKVTQQIKSREGQTSKYRDNVAFTSDKFSKIKENRQMFENRIGDLQKKLHLVTNKKEITAYSCKTYEHILERMKKDDITMQLNKNLLEKQIRALQKNYSVLEHKHSNITDFQRMSHAGLKDGQTQLDEQKFYREQFLGEAKKEMQLKIQQTNKLKERQKQTEEIKELAADNIQDADLIKLQKFLTTQLFLRKLLKEKILRLKQFYQPHERAFFKIKTNTSIKDADSLKSEFFNFEESYNEKTAWVKHLQTSISEEQAKRKSLDQELHLSRMQQMEIMEIIEAQEKMTNDLNIRELNDKSLQHELCYERIQSWVTQQIKNLGISSNSQDLVAQFDAVIAHIQPLRQIQT